MEPDERIIVYNKNNWVIFCYANGRPEYLDPVELYNNLRKVDTKEYWTARVSGNNPQAISRVPKEVRDMFFFWTNMLIK